MHAVNIKATHSTTKVHIHIYSILHVHMQQLYALHTFSGSYRWYVKQFAHASTLTLIFHHHSRILECIDCSITVIT